MPDQVRRYKDKKGEWRWKRVDLHSGTEVGASSEGYVSKTHMQENAERINGPESETLQYVDWVDE